MIYHSNPLTNKAIELMVKAVGKPIENFTMADWLNICGALAEQILSLHNKVQRLETQLAARK